jgi:hypothetical protein
MTRAKPARKLKSVPTTERSGLNAADLLQIALCEIEETETKLDWLRTTIHDTLALLKKQGVEPTP